MVSNSIREHIYQIYNELIKLYEKSFDRLLKSKKLII